MNTVYVMILMFATGTNHTTPVAMSTVGPMTIEQCRATVAGVQLQKDGTLETEGATCHDKFYVAGEMTEFNCFDPVEGGNATHITWLCKGK